MFYRLSILKHKNPIRDGILADKDTKKLIVGVFYRIFDHQLNYQMKKILILFFISISLLACSGSDDNNNANNPFLNIPVVNLSLNLNLPEYTILKFPGNSVTITNQGVRGIVIYSIDRKSVV